VKILLLSLITFSTLFCKVDDKALYQELKKYDDNSTVARYNNKTNKVFIKKKIQRWIK